MSTTRARGLLELQTTSACGQRPQSSSARAAYRRSMAVPSRRRECSERIATRADLRSMKSPGVAVVMARASAAANPGRRHPAPTSDAPPARATAHALRVAPMLRVTIRRGGRLAHRRRDAATTVSAPAQRRRSKAGHSLRVVARGVARAYGDLPWCRRRMRAIAVPACAPPAYAHRLSPMGPAHTCVAQVTEKPQAGADGRRQAALTVASTSAARTHRAS